MKKKVPTRQAFKDVSPWLSSCPCFALAAVLAATALFFGARLLSSLFFHFGGRVFFSVRSFETAQIFVRGSEIYSKRRICDVIYH